MSYPDFATNAGFGVDAMNMKTNYIGRGDQIAALIPPAAGKIAICNVTGSGFVKGVVYEWNGSSWDAIAGDIAEMIRGSIRKILYINEPYPRIELWSQSTVGATLSNNDTDGGVQVVLNTTLNNRCSLSKKASARFTFSKAITFLGKIDISSSLRLLFRYGVGTPPANVFGNVRRQFQLEIDNNTDVLKNMFVTSSDGTTVSSVDTGQVGTATHQWRVEYRPSVDIKTYRDGTLVNTKTTNLPNSSDTGSDEEFTMCAQVYNTISKTIKFMYVQCAGEEAQLF